MTLTKNNTYAKVASVVVGLALVCSVGAATPAQAQTTNAQLQAQLQVLLAQLAALQAQLNGGVAVGNCGFTRDLTVGSRGTDVTCLQNYLTRTGHYSFSGGATGYFGPITQTAVARWQAANGVAPAAGYFGMISRAKYNALVNVIVVPPVDDDDDDSDTSGLSGGEANLTNFDFRSEDSSGSEGESDVELATAEFDVDDGDVRVERIDIVFSADDNAITDQPWQYFDTISVWSDGDMIADIDASDRDEWSETSNDVYEISLTGLDEIVREGDMAALTIAADIAESIDSDDLDQEFTVSVADDGIRAVDSEGLQQYIGEDSETISFSFSEEETGDVTIRSSSDDPDASVLVADESDQSDEYTIFVFKIENQEDVDVLLTDLTIDVDTDGGSDADEIIRTATLSLDGDEFDGDVGTASIVFEDLDYDLGEEESVTVELMVVLNSQDGNFSASGESVQFSINGSTDLEAEGADSGDQSDVGGSANSAVHTIALTGTNVEAISTSQSVVTPGSNASDTYGTYTIRFDVEAIDEDAYIGTTVAESGTVGATYNINGNSFSGSQTAVLSSTADTSGGFYVVDEGDSETFTLLVTLNPSTARTFSVELDSIRFNESASFTGSTVFNIDASNQNFETDPIYIAN